MRKKCFIIHLSIAVRTFFSVLLLPFIVFAGQLTVVFNTDQINHYGRAPLRLPFSEPMVPLGFSPDSVPAGLSLAPPVFGKWKWESQSTLLFTPDSLWCDGNRYIVTIPAGVESRISRSRLKKPFLKEFSIGSFSGRIVDPSDMRSTVSFVELRFSLRVHPDSLRKHLSGAGKSLKVLTSDSMFFRIRPKTGWPEGKRYTLSVDIGLTPCGGNMPLDSALSTSFFVSDTLCCLGLFRNNRKVSPLDTLFLEDDYTLEFSHPIRSYAFEDYSSVNGHPSRDIWPSENKLSVNRYLTPGRPWTLSLDAGFPSVDSAFLFKSLRFALIGDLNRIDPALPPFTIRNVTARYGKSDSIPDQRLSAETQIVLTPSLTFECIVDKKMKFPNGKRSGKIYCFTSAGKDTLEGHGDSIFYIFPCSLPANANCTLLVKAGYRAGGYQLKKDFTAIFLTGKWKLEKTCRPVINRWSRSGRCYGNYEYGDEPEYWLLPGDPAVPLERYGSPRVVAALRSVPVKELFLPEDTTRFSPHCWRFDTLPGSAHGVDWYEYVPLRLAPALSTQGRGTAKVLLSVNGAKYDTLGRYRVTDLNLQLMKSRLMTAVALTSLTARIPLANAQIALFGKGGTVIAQGSTDSTGFFRIPRPLDPYFVTAAVPGDTLVYKTVDYSFRDTVVSGGTIITDRELYRPGDTLYFKGFVRRLGDRWEHAKTDSAVVTIEWKGAKAFHETLPLYGCGSFSGAVAIPAGAARTYYSIAATLRRINGNIFGRFRVAEFRPAELTCRAGDGIVDGDSVKFAISAKWLHGGAAGGSPVAWKCRIIKSSLSWPGAIIYSGDHLEWDGFHWNNRWNADNLTFIDANESGSSIIDSAGRAIIAVARLANDSGAEYHLSATVKGSAVQSAQARNQIVIPFGHRLQIGCSGRTAFFAGDTAPLLLKAILENSEIAHGLKLRADLIRHSIVKKRIKNRCGLPAVIRDTVHIPVRTDNPVTDSLGIAMLRTASLPEGDYTVTVTPQSPRDRRRFSFDFTVVVPDTEDSDSYRELEGDEGEDIDGGFTIVDIDSGMHDVGTAARIGLRAARDSCNVLLTVRRENLYERRWIAMTGRDTTVTMPIRDEYIPIVKIQASFLPPLRKNSRGWEFEQSDPLKHVAVNLHVSPESRRIPVQVTTDRAMYAPGDTVTVHLAVPPKFASATALLMTVDEGVLRLSGGSLPCIVDRFTRDAIDIDNFKTERLHRCLYGSFNYDSMNQVRLHPCRGAAGMGYGAGYGSGFGGSGSGGIDDLIGGLMGGGEGEGLTLAKKKGNDRLSNPPRPCAFFNPRVTFDAGGRAVCRFMLPGNLTRWRVTAVVDDTASFGEDTVSFEANKPLMVRPQLPQFLRMGDSASARYIVENRSKNKRTIISWVTAHGDTAVDTFTLPSDGIRQSSFPLIGRVIGMDSLLFIAQSDTLGDGIKIILPTVFERTRDVAAIGGSTIDSTRIPVILPKPAKIDSGNLTLTLSTTRMQDLAEGMQYLFDYPYGCLEQQSSKILPLLMLGDFTRRFNLRMLSKGDEKLIIQTYLDHIGDFQNDSDGGLGYWPTDSGCSSPWLTAFVLEIMIKAKAAGYAVNDGVYSHAFAYLKREMRRRDSGDRKRFLDSYTLLVEAEAGKPDRGALRRLYKKADTLSFPARINLLKAMHAAGRFKGKVRALQKNLRRGLIEKDRLAYIAPEAVRGFEFCHESPVRLSALTLEALLETGSKSRFDEPMIRWLTVQRRHGRWRTTQENMAVFRAFAAYTGVYEKDTPKLNAAAKLAGSDWFTAALEGREGASAHASRSLDSIAATGETEVAVNRSGSGRLYWDLLLYTFPSGNAPAASSGLSIRRSVMPVDEAAKAQIDPSRLTVGEILKVELTVRCNQDITFAAINDPVPAGCEAVDPELATGEQDIALKMTDWNGPARLSHREFRDSRVLLFLDEMPAGEYRFSYLLKPTTAGKFHWPAPFAEAMYYPEIYGRGAEGTVKILEKR